MSGRYLLDTNVAIAILKADQAVLDHLAVEDEFLISATVAGELFYGALNSANVDENVRRIQSFLLGAALLSCDETTSRLYGEVKTQLRQKSRPIPDNDIWIAASTLQHSLILVTRDSHFDEVEGLQTVNW